ncbi:hypothetical protein C5167_012968 [Papaver somniferum]|uniref:TMEM205-like domain-containing protein n=1 Tax=Papaver somniferum TaxID=3469 RepID=A0A4Y7J2Z1_PAPSO|nr:hypothetical protein C5167_012968 [Papaver somniferum]
MMNILAIFLVITSIAAGGIFSPHEKEQRNDDLIVKEGHRLIVVEYERETINPNQDKLHHHHPQQQQLQDQSSRSRHHHQEEDKEDKPLEHGLSSASSMLGRANERLKDSMPDLSQTGITSESISDAYEKSKEAVDETVCRAKECIGYKGHLADIAAEGVQHTAEAIKGKAQDIRNADSFGEAIGNIKDTTVEKVKLIPETTVRAKEAVQDSQISRSLSESLGQAKGKVMDKVHDVQEAIEDIPAVRRAEETIHQSKEKVMDKAHDVKQGIEDSPSVRRVHGAVSQAKEKVMDKTHDFKEAVEGSEAAEMVTKTIPEAVHHAKDKVLEKAHDLKEAVEDSEGLSQVKGKVSEKAHNVKEAVGDARETAAGYINGMPGTLSYAKGKVSEKAHNVKEAVGDAGETAAGYMKGMPETVNQAREKVSDKAHSVKEAFEDARDTLAESIPETASDAKEKVIDRAQSVKEAIGGAKESATEKAKRLPETIHHAKENILDKAHDLKDAVEDTRTHIPETLKQAKDKVYKKIHSVRDKSSKAKEEAAEKAHDLKQSAKELLTDEKEKASQESGGLIKMAKDKILNRAHEIKEGAGNVKESVEFVAGDLKENVRMTESAITDQRTKHQKTTMLFKEGARNFTNVFQRGWEMAVSEENIKWGLGVIRMVGFGTAYGSSVWVSFVSGHLLARVLPRQQFAAVQRKIYPVYFRLIGYSIGSSMLGQMLTGRYQSPQTEYRKGEKLHAYDLGMALVFVLINSLFLEPRATKVMLEKMKWEKEEGRGLHGPGETRVRTETRPARSAVGEEVTEELVTERSHEEEVERRARERANNEIEQLNQRLKKLNRYSAFFNILTIMALTWHIAYLAQCLYVSC